MLERSDSVVELEADAAGEQRHDEMVEADALGVRLSGELSVQGGGHSDEELSAGFHAKKIPHTVLTSGIGTDTVLSMPAAHTTPKFSASQRIQVLVTDFELAGFPEVWKPATITTVERREDGKLDVSITRDDGRYAHQIVGVCGGNRRLRAL